MSSPQTGISVKTGAHEQYHHNHSPKSLSRLGHQDLVPNARLMLVASFADDLLTAFEFGFLTANGQFHVCQDSSYYAAPGSDIGQYLSYASLALLAWLKGRYTEKTQEPGQGIN